MRVKAAHAQLVRLAFEAQAQTTGFVAGDGFDGGGAHHAAPVDLPENLRVEPLHQFFERGAQQHFAAVMGEHAHVFVGRFQAEHIVHRLRFKRGHRVLVISRHKHQQRKGRVARPVFSQLGGGFEPALAGHADVKKQHIGAVLQSQLHRAQAVACRGQHLQRGPQGAQFALKGLGQQGFVFGDRAVGWVVMRWRTWARPQDAAGRPASGVSCRAR